MSVYLLLESFKLYSMYIYVSSIQHHGFYYVGTLMYCKKE